MEIGRAPSSSKARLLPIFCAKMKFSQVSKFLMQLVALERKRSDF